MYNNDVYTYNNGNDDYYFPRRLFATMRTSNTNNNDDEYVDFPEWLGNAKNRIALLKFMNENSLKTFRYSYDEKLGVCYCYFPAEDDSKKTDSVTSPAASPIASPAVSPATSPEASSAAFPARSFVKAAKTPVKDSTKDPAQAVKGNIFQKFQDYLERDHHISSVFRSVSETTMNSLANSQTVTLPDDFDLRAGLKGRTLLFQ